MEIGLLVQTLIFDECKNTGWKMCDFLVLHYSGFYKFSFKGELYPDSMTLTGDGDDFYLRLGVAIDFGEVSNIKMKTQKGGDSLHLEGVVCFWKYEECFPGIADIFVFNSL